MNQDTVTKLLRPGEQILWSSMSNPGKLMDEKNKQRNTRWFIIVGGTDVPLCPCLRPCRDERFFRCDSRFRSGRGDHLP